MSSDVPPDPASGFLTEVTFDLRDDSFPLVTVSETLGCRFDVLDTIRTADGHTILFCRVRSASVDQVREQVRRHEGVSDLRIHGEFDAEFIAEITLRDCLLEEVAAMRAIMSEAVVEDGLSRFTIILPPDRDTEAVVDAIAESHLDISVAAVRDRELAAPLLTPGNFRSVLTDRLTERQWEALRLAFEGGYFTRPRESSQDELSAAMGISQETFSQHLRAAQRQLLDAIFEEMGG